MQHEKPQPAQAFNVPPEMLVIYKTIGIYLRNVI